jgi:hypothetical protein
MAALMFFIVFTLNVIYLFLAKGFVSQINLDRDDPSEGSFSLKNSKLLMKYVFFIDSSNTLSNDARSLLWVIRIVLVLSMSIFAALLIDLLETN